MFTQAFPAPLPSLTEKAADLPDFGLPPVVETVVGVEFTPLTGWDVRHFGLLWERIRGDYPEFQVHPALGRPDSSKAEDAFTKNLIISVLGTERPPIRAWFIDPSNTRLLQVQEDRFIHNWRKVVGDEAYPHYEESVRPEFVRCWARFVDFLKGYDLPEPILQQWDVTYVNHLERGREWETVADLQEMFLFLRKLPDGFLPAPKYVHWNGVYPIEGGGQLSVTLQPTVRVRDRKEVVQLTLEARGKVQEPSLEELLACFDRGRRWIVQGFSVLTAPHLQSLWERKTRG